MFHYNVKQIPFKIKGKEGEEEEEGEEKKSLHDSRPENRRPCMMASSAIEDRPLCLYSPCKESKPKTMGLVGLESKFPMSRDAEKMEDGNY